MMSLGHHEVERWIRRIGQSCLDDINEADTAPRLVRSVSDVCGDSIILSL